MATTELVAKREDQIARRFGRMVEASANVVDVADRTHTIPRDERGNLIRPRGMSDAEWNIHCDAMCSSRDVPSYLAQHYRRVETAQKIAGLRGAELPPIAGYMVRIVERKNYETVDVTAPKEAE
jgi:hypothetical protein